MNCFRRGVRVYEVVRLTSVDVPCDDSSQARCVLNTLDQVSDSVTFQSLLLTASPASPSPE
jgi:hypothetical protein